MKKLTQSLQRTIRNQEGKMGWALLWLLGVPLPILLVLYALRGCQ